MTTHNKHEQTHNIIKSQIMKKAILTFGLFSLMMVLTSFTSPEIGGNSAPRSITEIGGNSAPRSIGGNSAPRSITEIGGNSAPRSIGGNSAPRS